MTNKGLITFVLVFFVVTSIGNYYMLYQGDVTQAITTSTIASLLLVLFFFLKRKWDKRK